ncbi:MAG: hypothetical protein QOG66_1430 [Methylobacteriaceae bacterium]|nr:hypothetical protein [Methylobacteriaceae bacterium]
MAYEHILYEVSDKIATITLNRPDRMNAWTPVMERDVRHAMEASSADDNVRVIVLTGAGRAFCAGADMDALKGLDPNDIRRASNLPPFDMNRRPDWQTRYGFYPSIGKPVIAMLNGATAGIGLVHALYCDLRFAADNTVFTTAFARRGLIAEHGISWMLPRIVGHANAMDLLLSARRVGSEEALRIGLVNRLCPPEKLREETYAYARDLADFVSPSAMAVIKRQLYEVPFQTLREATIEANREMMVALNGSDFREGVASFMEKRPPRFTGREGEICGAVRLRPAGLAGHHASRFGLLAAAPRVARRAKRGGARRDRTADLVIANDALSQLSYGPVVHRSGQCGRQPGAI